MQPSMTMPLTISQIRFGMMNEELNDWIRDRTHSWVSPGPRHCLSDRYQPWNPDSMYPGMPSFVLEPPPRQKDPSWPSAEPDETIDWDKSGWKEQYREYDVKKVQLARETWNGFAKQLAQEDSSERRRAYLNLTRQRDSMQKRAEKYASRIDSAFQVDEPDTGKTTNLLQQALQAYHALGRVSSEHGSSAALGEVYSADTEMLNWRGETDFVPPVQAGLSRPQREAYSRLGSLTEIGRRPCLLTEEIGFRCGLPKIPADAELNEVVVLFELHFTGVENKAEEMCNTHALLSYRLQTLESVLRGYELYDKVETVSFADVSEAVWPHERELDERRTSVRDLENLLKEIKEALESSKPKKRRKVWNVGEEEPTPSSSGLDEVLSMRILRKEGGEPITPQRVGQIVSEHFEEIHLLRLREAAGVN